MTVILSHYVCGTIEIKSIKNSISHVIIDLIFLPFVHSCYLSITLENNVLRHEINYIYLRIIICPLPVHKKL
jgi:hypothetical protein